MLEKTVIIRLVQPDELPQALSLVERVFMRYVAPDYPPQGIDTFRAFLADPAAVAALTLYGAYDETGLLGVLAMRGSSHIALFFVEAASQGKGIGRALFSSARDAYPEAEMTVHSSPYAVEIYQKLGFHVLSEEQFADGIRYTPMKAIFRKGETPC